MKRRLIIAASLFVFNLSSGFAAENIPFSPQPPEIHAGSWVLMDYTTGQILTAGNEHQQRNPASLTKLMTGYLGVDAGYTFTYSEDQALTPYFKLAYVYDDSNNDNDVNGDSIDNGTEGSAVRVGLGTQFSFTKNFSAYTDANYLGGGDVDQDWSANVGVKYTW